MLSNFRPVRQSYFRVYPARISPFSVLANLGRHLDAKAVLDLWLAAHPADERALYLRASHLLDSRNPAWDPSEARRCADKIDALPKRTAKDGDPTAISPAHLPLTPDKVLAALEGAAS